MPSKTAERGWGALAILQKQFVFPIREQRGPECLKIDTVPLLFPASRILGWRSLTFGQMAEEAEFHGNAEEVADQGHRDGAQAGPVLGLKPGLATLNGLVDDV